MPSRFSFLLGQTLPSLPRRACPPHSVMWFGGTDPTTAPAGLQSRAQGPGLGTQFVPTFAHYD